MKLREHTHLLPIVLKVNCGPAPPLQRQETSSPSCLSHWTDVQTEALGKEEGGSCSQRGRLASAVVAQEGGDVALVEVQAEPTQGGCWVARKALFQPPYGDPRNQTRWGLFHQLCERRQSVTGAPGRPLELVLGVRDSGCSL